MGEPTTAVVPVSPPPGGIVRAVMVEELFVQATTKVPAGSPATNGLPRSLRDDRSVAGPQPPPAGWSAPYTGTGLPSPVYWPNDTMTLPVLSIAVSIPSWLPTSQATGGAVTSPGREPAIGSAPSVHVQDVRVLVNEQP